MEPISIIIYILLGLVASILGSMLGLGGGFLMVPILIFTGFTKDYAPVISLFVIFFIAASSSIMNCHKKIINYKLGLIFAPFSMMGAFLGAFLLHLVDNLVFKIIFTIIIIYTCIKIVFLNDTATPLSPEPPKKPKSKYWIILWGFLTGLSASFLGIGGGLIAVPVITLFFLESIYTAIATSLFIMIFTSIASSIQNSILGFFDSTVLIIGLIIAIGAVFGSQIGTYLKSKIKSKTLRIIFAVIVIGLALPLLWINI